MSQTILINVYYAKFESVLKYGIIFWGGVHKDFKDIPYFSGDNAHPKLFLYSFWCIDNAHLMYNAHDAN
jgi:hypothetical protein